MRGRFLLLVVAVSAFACTNSDRVTTTTTPGDSVGSPPPPPPPGSGDYEMIDLAPGAMSAQATAINDDGTIVGVRADSGSEAYDFIYKNGVMRPLVGANNVPRADCCTPTPAALSATEKIAGGSGIFVALWDAPDATPRAHHAG